MITNTPLAVEVVAAVAVGLLVLRSNSTNPLAARHPPKYRSKSKSHLFLPMRIQLHTSRSSRTPLAVAASAIRHGPRLQRTLPLFKRRPHSNRKFNNRKFNSSKFSSKFSTKFSNNHSNSSSSNSRSRARL